MTKLNFFLFYWMSCFFTLSEERTTFISKEDIEDFLLLGTTLSEVASVLQISRPTLYNLMQEYNIMRTKFSNISDVALDATVSQIEVEQPHVGEMMLNGHLRTRRILLQRRHVRDSEGLTELVLSPGQQQYTVPFPNYIWHIDGNHKPIRWKSVVHGAMDGFSRMLMFLQCCHNNQAETVMDLYSTAISKHGRPFHIQTDHRGKNVRIWEDMREHRDENSVLTGNSVHNQWTGRFNRDLNRNCHDVFAPIFWVGVNGGLRCRQWNRFILSSEFKAVFTNHSVFSERNRTPVQLFTLDRHLLLLHHPEAANEERTVDSASASHADYSFCTLNQQDIQKLAAAVKPLEHDGNKGKTLYHRVQEFVFHKIVNV